MLHNKRLLNLGSVLVLVVLVLTQLTGCSATSRSKSSGAAHPGSDCAPNFNIDVSKIPDAVPKPEPYSKYGNPPSYVACGQRYYVMKSAKGYCKKGIASWYGMKFHEVRTSSGEMYDVTKMTAAHCTLPIPTYALVTNLKTGKHVIVKINDRGPFVANRLIDLSYVAAVKLGVTAHGTALVEVRTIDASNPDAVLRSVPKRAPIAIGHQPCIYLQLGAFGVRANAEQLAEKVKCSIPYEVMIKSGDHNGKPIYRVQIGPVPNVDVSDEVYEHLKGEGLGKPIVVVQ